MEVRRQAEKGKIATELDVLSIFKLIRNRKIPEPGQQSGTTEACWAHNPEVDGLKPPSASTFVSTHYSLVKFQDSHKNTRQKKSNPNT